MNWQVFTDGASSPDDRGGWAYVVVMDDIEIRRGQGSALGVTHQRMEIRAVAEALLAFPREVPVEVIGDSAYAIDCFVKGWHVRSDEFTLPYNAEGRAGTVVGGPTCSGVPRASRDSCPILRGCHRSSGARCSTDSRPASPFRCRTMRRWRPKVFL
jgi:hypothetical protein